MTFLILDGCALSGLHYLMVSPCRAHIRSAHSRPLIPKHLNSEKSPTRRDGGIGNVERRPPITMKINFNEVDHVPIADAIIEIAKSAGENQTERGLEQSLAQRCSPGIDNHSDNGSDSQDGEDRGFHRRLYRI